MNTREGTTESTEQGYVTKKVVINGQTVTLYSQNGHTWLSTPDQIPDVMARLDNTRVLLNDGKGEQKVEGAPAPAAPAPKPTAARYRLRGPKPRPILQPDGSLAPVVEREPVSATETEVTLGPKELQIVPPRVSSSEKRSTKFSERNDKGVVHKVSETKSDPKRDKVKEPVSKRISAKGAPEVKASIEAKPMKASAAKKGMPAPVAKAAAGKPAANKAVLKAKGKAFAKKKGK